MKRKANLLIIGSMTAALVLSGGMVLSNNAARQVWAATATFSASATPKPTSTAKPPAAKPGSPLGKNGAGHPQAQQGNQGCTNNQGMGHSTAGIPSTDPAGAGATGTTGTTGTAGATAGNIADLPANSVVISGGFDTDPKDHGRPDVLIAAVLGVPTEVFREAFSGVTPAGLDSGGPTDAEAQSNKAALLKVLATYGITNARLNEVSDYYRYNSKKGQTWPRTQATATAIVKDGVVTGVTITNGGSGYSSTPTVTITGQNGQVTATATVVYTSDFKTNGSISAITIQK